MLQWIVTLAPYVVLFTIWLYFMKQFMGRGSKYGQMMERQRAHMERVEQQLERIAVAMEKPAGSNR